MLQQNSILFNYWMRELCKAFADLLQKTYYEPILPLKLKNLYVADDGLKLNFRNINLNMIGFL